MEGIYCSSFRGDEMISPEHREQKTEHRGKNEEIIRCDGIWKIYNEGKPHEVRALVDVSLEVGKGSFTIINGPSGSGKTTFISIIGTIDRPSRGRLNLDGKDITDLSDVALSLLRRRRIGFVFQNFNLISRLSAWENVSIPLIPQGIRGNDRKLRATQLLDMFGLSGRAHHTPEEMSGGEHQRVAIARALINNPDIVILDEPTSNIDEEAVSILIDILKGLKADGKTIIVSSHEEDLLRNADIVFKLKKGRITGTENP
jgi:putative ABC transport system ATP-binding protein